MEDNRVDWASVSFDLRDRLAVELLPDEDRPGIASLRDKHVLVASETTAKTTVSLSVSAVLIHTFLLLYVPQTHFLE